MRILILIGVLCGCAAAHGVELATPPTVEVTAAGAVVHWQTDVACGTRAYILPNAARISVPDKTPAADHTVTVTGLQPGVVYSIVVGSAKVWLATNTFTSTGAGTAAMPPALTAAAPIQKSTAGKTVPAKTEFLPAPPTRKIWANWPSLPDHFARHGGDFHAKDQDEYARMSWQFLQRAKAEGLPAKVDEEGVLRVFDARTGTFASYNRNGTTKTFFKPGSNGYFERQPGERIDLKNWREN